MKTVEEFWAKVDKTDGCWNWKGGTDGSGRGILTWQDKREYAYRVAYVISKGEIPNGARLTQTCKNLRCVRFEHLKDKAKVIKEAEAAPSVASEKPAEASKRERKETVRKEKPVQPQETRLFALLVEFQKEIEKMEKERDQALIHAFEMQTALVSVCDQSDSLIKTIEHIRGLLVSPSVIQTMSLARSLMDRMKEKRLT